MQEKPAIFSGFWRNGAARPPDLGAQGAVHGVVSPWQLPCGAPHVLAPVSIPRLAVRYGAPGSIRRACCGHWAVPRGWVGRGGLGEVGVPSLRPCPPQFLREEYYEGRYCAVWQNVTRWAQKKNVYTLWVTNSSCGVAPVHYEMRGYNSLLGSHYDKYEIAYADFDNSYPPSVFDLPVNGEPGMGRAPCPVRGARADSILSSVPSHQVRGAAGERGGAPRAGKPHGGPGGAAPALGTPSVPRVPAADGAALRLRAGAGAQAEHLRAQHEVPAAGGDPCGGAARTEGAVPAAAVPTVVAGSCTRGTAPRCPTRWP